MKAQELRIGNLLMELTSDDIFEVSDRYFSMIDINIKCCRPIPLTEEWLLKMEFEYSRDEFLFNNGYFDLIFNDNKVSLRVEGQWLSLEIKHVHQLQNLYFALTGCELEIK